MRLPGLRDVIGKTLTTGRMSLSRVSLITKPVGFYLAPIQLLDQDPQARHSTALRSCKRVLNISLAEVGHGFFKVSEEHLVLAGLAHSG